jgi:hypothetical protein
MFYLLLIHINHTKYIVFCVFYSVMMRGAMFMVCSS